jgi:hypothetical protein
MFVMHIVPAEKRKSILPANAQTINKDECGHFFNSPSDSLLSRLALR